MDTAEQQLAAVLLYDGCTIAEIIEVATRLTNNGVEVEWVGVADLAVRDQSGLVATPAASIEEIDPQSITMLLIPGGDPRSVMGIETVRSFVRGVAEQGTVAGICGGSLVIADAGLVRHRRVTHNYRAPWSPPEIEAFVAEYFAEAHIEDDRSVGVVTDGPIITALPNATAEFSIAVCVAAGIYDSTSAERLVRHLQGDFVAELFGEHDPPDIASGLFD